MKNLRIEEVGNINNTYRNLEVFFNDENDYFLYIGISEDRKLFFDISSQLKKDVNLTVEEWEYILITAKSFLPKALSDEDSYQKRMESPLG
jgi:hypothetical protein